MSLVLIADLAAFLVDQASELAIVMAKYFAKPLVAEYPSTPQGYQDLCDDVIKDQMLMSAIAKVKGDKYEDDEIAILRKAFAEFSLLYAKRARVKMESEQDIGKLDMMKNGKGSEKKVKGNGKAAASGAKGEEEMSGPWEGEYEPLDGFQAC